MVVRCGLGGGFLRSSITGESEEPDTQSGEVITANSWYEVSELRFSSFGISSLNGCGKFYV